MILASQNVVWNIPVSFIFQYNLESIGSSYSSRVSELICEPVQTGTFIAGECLMTLNFFGCNGSVHIFQFLLVSFWECVDKNLPLSGFLKFGGILIAVHRSLLLYFGFLQCLL